MKILFAALSLALTCHPAPAADLKEIVVALKPDKNPEAMLAERRELETFLSAQLGSPVKVIIPLSGAVIQESLIGGTIDIAFVSGMEMIQAEKNSAADLLLAVEIEGKNSYQSYWVTAKGKPYQSVKDLKGQPVAFASRTSTSGYLIPAYDLVKQKLLPAKADPAEFFGKGHVSFGTGYVSAIERVLNGQAEAAAVSDYVIKKDKHLTLEQKSQLRVMAKQGPVPTHIVAVRKGLNAQTRKKIEAALLSFNQKPELRDRLFTAKLVRADPRKHLASLKEALALTGIQL